jgi:hypothetical protein
LLQLFGQMSVVFVFIMGAMRLDNGAFTPSLILAIGLMLVMVGVITQMKDPPPREM